MKFKSKQLIEEYRASKNTFIQLGEVVSEILKNEVKSKGIEVLTVEHRIKTEKSLQSKIEQKSEKYSTLSDVTDILGARVVCYFSDDVDRIAEFVAEKFDVDWEHSVDKRKQLRPNAFGYLSIHYICSLPDNGVYQKSICDKKFEIQIRSILQHTWAEINHDLGYKSDFGVPKQITRDFSRIAGLLEIADREFIRVRDNINQYSDEIRRRIADNEAEEIEIDLVSLTEYVHHNKTMNEFLDRIAKATGADIRKISPEIYVEQLLWLGKKKLGDLQKMLEEVGELAFNLCIITLEQNELDILSSNIGLRYLCRAELLMKNYSPEKMEEFFYLSLGSHRRAKRQVTLLLENYKKMQDENNEPFDDESYEKALEYATEKHKGQLRLGGEPYITHPVAVAESLKEQGYGIDYQIAGLFHDLLEDTDAKENEIKELGNEEILKAVKLMTKDKENYNPKAYVEGIKKNKMAFTVKKADRLHNLKSAVVSSEGFKRRYIKDTVDWYWDFSEEIRQASRDLAKTLPQKLNEYPMLYEETDS